MDEVSKIEVGAENPFIPLTHVRSFAIKMA